MDTISLEPVLLFLDDLSRHNDKPWFEQNRSAYEIARGEFEHFTNYLIDEFRVADNLGNLTAKECLSRIYRDIRFSKDKSPYHTNLWATIAPGGKKATCMGYHVSIQPQGRSIVAGGMWQPTTEQLYRFRQAIDEDASELKEITKDRAFVDYFGSLEGERLKTTPQGFDRSHPEIGLLQLKQVVVVRHFSDQEVIAKDFLTKVVAGCQVMRPFLDYLNGILE
jgi:uncharacterized protein (TIGR02453 family)